MSNLQELLEQKNNHECTPKCTAGGSCFFLEDINQEIYTVTQQHNPEHETIDVGGEDNPHVVCLDCTNMRDIPEKQGEEMPF